MQILRFSLPNYNPTLPNLAPSIFSIYPAQTGHSQKLLQHPSSRLSFDDSKNVSALRCSQLNCSRIVTVRCGMAQHDDGFYMRRCVELAKKAIGYTSPNPLVGCVIVKDGKIVGEGFHPKAGQPHAEVFALRDAGDLAENATAYVTLEPCNHYGRTPPCTEALLKAKVKKVVVGMVDPNPIVASKGLDKLRAAGLEVTVGVEEELCRNMNEAYIHQMLTGKPFVALRYSMSLNGHVLDQLGEGAADSGGYYSKLLQEYDAVITSSTLLSKKQSLPTSQEPGANQPLRVIISRGSDFGDEVPVSEPDSKLIIFADKERGQAPGSALNGIETVVLDQIGMNDILEHCKRQGLCSVLLDLRGNLDDYEELLKEGVEKNLLQKIMVEVLPVWDETDVGISRSRSLTSLAKGLQVRNLMPRVFNQSTILEGHIST